VFSGGCNKKNYFLRSEKRGLIFFGFVYAENDVILRYFIFWETAWAYLV